MRWRWLFEIELWLMDREMGVLDRNAATYRPTNFYGRLRVRVSRLARRLERRGRML